MHTGSSRVCNSDCPCPAIDNMSAADHLAIREGELASTQKPCPSACDISGYEQIRHERMQHEYATPDIKGVVAVIRQQERVMNPEAECESRSPVRGKSQAAREEVDARSHQRRNQQGDHSTPDRGVRTPSRVESNKACL